MSAAGGDAALFAIVGAGPSLDYAHGEIGHLIGRGAHFLVSDSVAAAFTRLYPGAKATIFTAELRRHGYLNRLPKKGMHPTDVMAYQKVPERNLRVAAAYAVTRFRLHGEKGDLPALYSPGTVLGVMLSY